MISIFNEDVSLTMEIYSPAPSKQCFMVTTLIEFYKAHFIGNYKAIILEIHANK
jgi:hypothetical protein